MANTIKINRAPVLTLWAAVVAERLGFDWDEALTFGRAVAGLNAYSKGVHLGLFTPAPESVREERRKAAGRQLHGDLLGRSVPAVNTAEGLRALSKDRSITPVSVQRYLDSKFGPGLSVATAAMRQLARSRTAARLAKEGFHLYEQFRPHVPAGVTGWGAAGELHLDVIRDLAKRFKET
ncbi:MAG: hypothetical protein ACLQME_17735 [Alphaproteobacteria bacterium]